MPWRRGRAALIMGRMNVSSLRPRSVVLPLAALVALVACRGGKGRNEAVAATPDPTKTPQAIPSTSVSNEAGPIAPITTADASIPSPTPPAIACTTSPHLRWAVAPEHAFSCSPFRSATSPSELAVAPGTLLRFSVAAALVDDAADAVADVDPRAEEEDPNVVLATYTRQGFPKGAWIDPDTLEFKWKVTGSEGDVFAFSIAAFADLDEGKRCVVGSLVVRVRDDASTRKAQVISLAREDTMAAEFGSLGQFGDLAELKRLRELSKCGGVPTEPAMWDADGDGLTDALFDYPWGAGRSAPQRTAVWVRRGDTFAHLGDATGRAYRMQDGVTLIVRTDDSSWATPPDCNGWLEIARVFKNRVEKSAVEPSFQGQCHHPTDGLHLAYSGSTLSGYTWKTTDKSGKAVTKTWTWNGKGFAAVP
jgi:hypothetical protein